MKPLSMELAVSGKDSTAPVRMSPTINILTRLLGTTVHLLKPKDIVPNFFYRRSRLDETNERREKPFFAYITTNAPHGPFIAPPKNAKRFTDLGFSERDAGFYGMIENIDENMGRLMNKLDQWKLSKNTILIFMSDNGPLGEWLGKVLNLALTRMEKLWRDLMQG